MSEYMIIPSNMLTRIECINMYPILAVGITVVNGLFLPICSRNSEYNLIIPNAKGVAIMDDINKNMTDIITLALRCFFSMILSFKSAAIDSRIFARFPPVSLLFIII